MKRLFAVCLASFALAGCSTLSGRLTYPSGAILPPEAIQRAAAAAPKPIHGLFYIYVRTTGRERGQIYLNSENDYRDQRNITVVIRPEAVQPLEASLGKSVDAAFTGKSLLVRGAAYRVKVNFYSNGKPTDKYYYQTHVIVSRADQITAHGI